MPKLKERTPAYRLHRPSGQAVVTLSGKDFYLGAHRTKASCRKYDELVAEWLANGRRLASTSDAISVTELLAHYVRFCRARFGNRRSYVKNLSRVRCALRPVKRLFGVASATELGPRALIAVRQQYIGAGLARKTVNDNVQLVKRMFRWAVREELVPPSVYHGLSAVEGLRSGESEATEPRKVRPVPDEHVNAVRKHVSRQVWAMIELQWLTGMRSGEVVIMRGRDLDMNGRIWIYRPESHKTQHHGHDRVVEIGPRAQRVIRPFLKPDLEAYLFSPADVVAEQKAEKRRRRRTNVQPSQRDRSKRDPKRSAGERYTPDSYSQAISRACKKAGIPHWHPHQLRHNYATRVRREYGIETARILLGHRSAFTTEIYAEVDRMKAREIVARIG